MLIIEKCPVFDLKGGLNRKNQTFPGISEIIMTVKIDKNPKSASEKDATVLYHCSIHTQFGCNTVNRGGVYPSRC